MRLEQFFLLTIGYLALGLVVLSLFLYMKWGEKGDSS